MSARALALTPAGWWLQHHLRVRRHDQRAASYAPTRASNWLSPPRRSRRGQCDGERITTQHHEREQGSHARFQCRSPAARRRSGRVRLRFPPPGPWPPTLARSALRAATECRPPRFAHWRGPRGPCAGLPWPTGRCWSCHAWPLPRWPYQSELIAGQGRPRPDLQGKASTDVGGTAGHPERGPTDNDDNE